jgi:DNA polymerase III epsilon subunit family exonuclease
MSQRKFNPDKELNQVTFVVLDLETSGASATTGSAITEIGAVKICGGEVKGTFQTLINPKTPLSPFITELTGITDLMLIDAPSIDTILPLLFEFIGSPEETIFVAHNAPFDLSFLKAASVLHGYIWPDFRTIDTVKLARLVLSKDDVANFQLGTLARHFNTHVAPSHRALDDAHATVDVRHGVIERLGSFGILTINQLLAARGKNSQKHRTVIPATEKRRPNL